MSDSVTVTFQYDEPAKLLLFSNAETYFRSVFVGLYMKDRYLGECSSFKVRIRK